MKNNHVTSLTVDLNSVDFNLAFFNSKLQDGTKIMAVVKAFGYGSDAVKIAKHIQSKVHYFAVAYTKEGIALREEGIEIPILVLHPQIQNLELLVRNNLEPNLYNKNILDSFLAILEKEKQTHYPIHIKFNTGLNRLGFSENDISILATKVKGSNRVEIKSIFSHLAASEDLTERKFTLQQIAIFKRIASNFESEFGLKPMMHLCNTSGVINFSEAQFDMVRIGIGLFGFGNSEKITNQLKNVISLSSVISQIHQIKKGESVGYNRDFIASKKMKTATIPIGHADGFYRSLGQGKGFVTINNQKAYIIGNVCMDMIMVDITDNDCKEGDSVIIFNSQKSVVELAEKANTISYEFITSISQRIQRISIQ